MALECGGWDVKALKAHIKILVALVGGSMLLAFATVWQCVPLEGSLFLAALPLSVAAYEGKWYIKPVGVYVCVCSTLVFREVFVVSLSLVPCGLCYFRSTCLEPGPEPGLEGDGQCTRWRSDSERCWQVTTKMDNSWMLWGSIPPLLGCLGFMLHLLRRFYVADLQLWLQARVAVILMIPTTYAICSFYSLRLLTVNDNDLWTARAVFDVSELYVALSLLAFMYLCIGCARRACENIEQEETKRRGSWQSRIVEAELEYNQKAWEIGKGLMSLGCWPYVIVCFCGNLMEIIMKEFINFWVPELCGASLPALVRSIFPTLTNGHLKPPERFVAFEFHRGSFACQEFWGAISPTVTAMNFLVCTIAVTCIVSYEQVLGNVLESISPKAKFMAVKGLLLVSFWQQNILPLVYPGEEAVQGRIYSFLICWESFLLAIYQWRSYDPAHFKEVASVDGVANLSDSVMLRLSRTFTSFGGALGSKVPPGKRSDDPTASFRSEVPDVVAENVAKEEEPDGATCCVS